MPQNDDELAKAYDRHYRQANHFGYRDWMYRPYLKAVTRKAALRQGATVLDAGCGQGLFTALFSDLGFQTTGVDLSEEGIRAARGAYGGSGARFIAADLRALEPLNQFDCVFTRSLSLYNDGSLASLTSVTDGLLALVKPGGVFVFDYYTRLGSRRKSDSWRYHSLDDLERHFARYSSTRTYFSLRLDAFALGSLAFSNPVSRLGAAISRSTGIGGELVAFVRKS